MTTETKHTPTRYSMIDSGFGRFQIIRHIPGTERVENIAHDLNYNRASEIVRACNAHDDLVAALELVLETVGGCHDCWELSASKEQQAFVVATLAKAKAGAA